MSVLSIHICRLSVVEAISLLCTRLNTAKKFRPDWLLALPLRHFLSGRCKPFDKPEMEPEALLKSWRKTVDELHLNNLKPKAEAGYVKFECKYCGQRPSLAHLLYILIIL